MSVANLFRVVALEIKLFKQLSKVAEVLEVDARYDFGNITGRARGSGLSDWVTERGLDTGVWVLGFLTWDALGFSGSKDDTGETKINILGLLLDKVTVSGGWTLSELEILGLEDKTEAETGVETTGFEGGTWLKGLDTAGMSAGGMEGSE